MNPDRATLNFLNTFPEKVRQEGEMLHRDGCVTQIFGNHLFVQGRVEVDRGRVFTTTMRLQGNRWIGESTSEAGQACACLVATMMERLVRGENLPEAPNEVGEKSLEQTLEEGLERELTEKEDLFLSKLERRFRRFMIEKKIFDHDLVRLHPKWEVTGYDALVLWPTPPTDIIEFWNYVAYALDKRNLVWPAFMKPVTDLEETRGKLLAWEREREAGEWEERMAFIADSPPSASEEAGDLRLLVTTSEAKLQWRAAGSDAYESVAGTPQLHQLVESHEKGALRLDAPSDLLWTHFLTHRQERGTEELRLEVPENGRLLNRLFRQSLLEQHIVTLDEIPFVRVAEPLRWRCGEVEAESGPDEDGVESEGDDAVARVTGIELEMADGERVPYALRVLPGVEELYLSDEAVFRGPLHWSEGTEVSPRHEIPLSVLASETGVEFLARIGADLPAELQPQVRDESMAVTIEASLAKRMTTSDGEHVRLDVTASDTDGLRREALGKDGWRVVERKPAGDGRILRFNRRALHRFPALLEALNVTHDAGTDSFRTRVVRTFPERFQEWVASLPAEVELKLDRELSTLLADPVKAALRFEVVDQQIDWFDLKIVLNVEGHDLSQEEIRELVAARGEFVRMQDGGWLRLQFDMGDDQMAAVARLGLDPFDLSQESHRMHALQLADPMAREVFDPEAWNRICDRAASVKLKVRPALPEGLNVDLRPYQVEGFHFLAYLTANGFGGILADDMGLGKTVQSLAWILWLRSQAEEKDRLPTLVVCPKSVLDVWAGEVRKFASEIRVQVLRNKDELDMEKVGTEIDLLVVNYSQMRVNSEKLRAQRWQAVILDEGQQIKNPDSMAAKASRELVADNRLVLTGTPIENRLLDVWSLMGFAMPGVLGNRKYFRDRFDRRKDGNAQTRLAARLRPFLIRRTKGQVAMDLPPRTEEDVLCNMETAQERLYREELERIQKQLLNVNTDDALRKNSFVVLQGLMRLRQICCHPALIDPKYAGVESAKMNALFYLLDQLREEGHKVLVFSQFVKMLNIIRERLVASDHPHHYLTGQTPDRGKVIEDFQKTKDPSVFLLSLKAGGSGLNLTAASYVVLYDPWWNPAVENQAIDRTHRIGQTSHVMAYRLLMSNSVEEKIRVLQNQKNEMAGGVLGEEGFTRTLEVSDLQFLFSHDEPEPAKRKGKAK